MVCRSHSAKAGMIDICSRAAGLKENVALTASIATMPTLCSVIAQRPATFPEGSQVDDTYLPLPISRSGSSNAFGALSSSHSIAAKSWKML